MKTTTPYFFIPITMAIIKKKKKRKEKVEKDMEKGELLNTTGGTANYSRH